MAIDPSSVDWTLARSASYNLRQTFRYEYSEPIRELNHRLVVVPPERMGDQHRLWHQVSARDEGARLESGRDRFGNVVYNVFAPRVMDSIEFVAEVKVERHRAGQNRLGDGWRKQSYLVEPSRLTEADARIKEAAARLSGSIEWGLPLADAINDWVYQSMTYRHGVTGVSTPASTALSLGVGVCQDYAHVMLAVCRACGLPSRYVSGHLLGQGGTHAWVEVVLPADDGSGDAIAWTFDPTHAGRGGLGYVTIAVGGDYSDVAPTSGTYRSEGAAGRLIASKTVTLTGLDYRRR